MAEVNRPKELLKHKILDKITQTNHEEENFTVPEVMVVAQDDLIGVLGVV